MKVLIRNKGKGFVRQLKSLSNNIGINIQAVFRSRSIQDVFRPKHNKPAIVRNQADYVGYTRRQLHQQIAEYKHSAL